MEFHDVPDEVDQMPLCSARSESVSDKRIGPAMRFDMCKRALDQWAALFVEGLVVRVYEFVGHGLPRQRFRRLQGPCCTEPPIQDTGPSQ